MLLMLALLVGLQAVAAVPSGYYNGASGKKDKALMVALHQIIRGHSKLSYSNVWTAYRTTDCNGTTIIDRYSNSVYTYSTDQCGTYDRVGDCYNREHSVPNSWWGGGQDTMYTDIYHLYPTDGYVNGIRGNLPFGNCADGTTYGTAKRGSSTFSGYSGTVFEPADEYKGDFARTYFYMATRYMTKTGNWKSGEGSVVFSGGYPGLTTYAVNLFLEWSRNDPVSAVERARNEAVYALQGNRNPFIDNPELVEYIWGNKTGTNWGGGGGDTPTPELTAPANGSTVNVGTNTGSGVSKTITVRGSDLTKALTVSVSGAGFTVTPSSISATNANNGTSITVTYNGTNTNATGTLTLSSSEVSTTVHLTATYNQGGTGGTGEDIVENWEGCSTGGYWTQAVQGHAFSWYFDNAGIWADANKNDGLSCRFGKNTTSAIWMTEDIADGASKVSFYAANWSASETAPTLQVQYSTDGGNTWVTCGTCSPTATWTKYSYDLNVSGDVRFKFNQTAGARFNIDDITITTCGSTPTPELTAPANGSTVNVGTIAATGTQVSKTINVKGNNLTKSLTVSVSGTGFSVTPATITAAAANAGTTVTVTYASANAGNAAGTLTIASSEVTSTVNLTASKEALVPELTSPTNGSHVNVGTNTGNGVSKEITVKGNNLTQALNVGVNGTGFSVSPSIVSASAANAGATVTVTYNGTDTDATGTLTVASSEVSSTVNLTASYNAGGEEADEIVETWEGCTAGGYWTQAVQGRAFSWYFSNAGIFADTNKNGGLSCRFGRNANSYIEMTEDIADGASKVSFYAANWSSTEATPTVAVQYSTDQGDSWTTIDECTLDTNWKQYSLDLNVTGNVRFKFQQTAGLRFNIDDIAITLNNGGDVPTPVISITPIDAIEAEQGGESGIVTATVTAENNEADITLSVEGNFQISLDRSHWATTLTLDPSGEVFYVRLANTATAGDFYGSVTATAGDVSAFADVQGTVNEPQVLMGDVNCDGIISPADISSLINYLLNGEANPFSEQAADLNHDGSISPADISALINLLLNGPSTMTRQWDAMPALGAIIIENPAGERIEVYNLDGDMVATTKAQGISTVRLQAGIYMVVTDTASRKVVVRPRFAKLKPSEMRITRANKR